MTLTIDDTRAVLKDAPLKNIVGFSSRLEGRKKFLAGGGFQFESTQSNIDAFRSAFPEVEIDDTRQDLTVFEEAAEAVGRPSFVFKRDPMPHQLKAFEQLKDTHLWAVFGDVGSGKSLILTTLGCEAWTRGKIDAILMVSLNGVIMQQWHDKQFPRDIPEEIPHQSWVWSKKKRDLEEYEKLKNFDGLRSVSINIDALNTKDGKALCEDFIAANKGRVLMVLDESQTVKSNSAQRSKAARALGLKCAYRAIASGTPMPKDLTDLWAQFNFLDPRIIGHKYLSSFRAEYTEQRHNGFAFQVVGVRQEKLGQFDDKIKRHTFRITKEELGFRDFDDEFEFELGPKEKAHFKSIKQSFLTELENGEILSVNNALSAMIRLQQVSNGFLPMEDGKLEVFECSRLAALQSYIEALSDEKVVLWGRFKFDAKIMMERFGKQAVDISGNVDAKARTEAVSRFISDPSIRFAVGTPKAAGVGTDGLQEVSNRAIYYSNSEHALDYWQSRARTSRIGGDMNAFYCHLIGKGTPDLKIMRNLQRKADISRATLDEIRMLLDA